MTRSVAPSTNLRVHLRAILSITAALIPLCGCGGGSVSTSTPSVTPETPAPQDAKVTGQYNLILASTDGRGSTNIYTSFTQAGSKLTGGSNTLICPSNDSLQCLGDDPAATSVTLNGTVSGTKVTVTVAFPTSAGTDTLTLTGTATGTNLVGTYIDMLRDAGTWTASAANHPFGPPPGVYDYSGTFNSTANPLTIAPSVFIELGQDVAANLTGKASILNSPCISSLTLSGHAAGDAFVVTDAAKKARIVALPTQPALATGNEFTFSYKFDATAQSCAGDVGRGSITLVPSWDY